MIDDPKLKKAVTSDLENAASFLSQALNRLHPSLVIAKEIKEVEDSLDTVIMALDAGDYDKEDLAR